MKTATIEILNEGEKIFGSRTAGEYFVREYEDGEEMGGGFFKTMKEAESLRDKALKIGDRDAFIVIYYKGVRMLISEDITNTF